MKARAERLEFATEQAIQEMGDEALKISKETMERLIYQHPIPVTKKGKPRWVRTRNLITNERLEVRRATLTATLVNKTRYARSRHDLGKPGKWRTPWPAPWRDITLAEIRKRFGPKIQSALHSVFAQSATRRP